MSVANMRAAYAEAQTAYLTSESGGNATYTAATTTANATVKVSGVTIKSQKADDWNGLDKELPFDAPTDPGTAGDKEMTFTYDSYGAITTVAFN